MQHDVLKDYDQDVARPRHEEMRGMVSEVKNEVALLKSKADQLTGTFTAGMKIIAVPSAILSALGIIRLLLALFKAHY